MLSVGSLLWVGMGGFLGASARYLVYAVALNAQVTLPYGTLFMNVTGSFLLAVLNVWFTHHTNLPDSVRLFALTGFLGSYTTFSTFSNEVVAFLRGGAWPDGMLYIFLTNALCLIAVVLGVWLAARWLPTA